MIEMEIIEQQPIEMEILSTGEVQTQTANITPTKQAQTVYPDEGHLFSQVNVGAMPDPLTQEKTVTPSDSVQTVEPDEDYLLSGVTVNPIPSQYYDISDATATAEDVNVGKTAYIAGGKVTGTNDYVKPEKGFYFLDCDDDGFYHTVVLKDCLSNYNFRGTFTTNANPNFGKKIENVHVYGYMYVTSAFTGNNAPKYYYLYGDDIRVGNNTFSNNYSVESVVFNGHVSLIYVDAFGNNNATMLYDFSQNTGVPSLYNTRALSHASGCVIKVPQSLLTEWQNANTWKDLTDVVWEGV